MSTVIFDQSKASFLIKNINSFQKIKNLTVLKHLNSGVENRLLREQLPALQVIKSLKSLRRFVLRYEESISIPKVVIVSYCSTDVL